MGTTILENLEVNEVSLVTRGANPGAKIALLKAENNEEILAMEELQKQLEELQKQLDEQTSEVTKLTSDMEGLTAENEELKKASEEKTDPIEKAKEEMPIDVREEFEKLQKSAEDQKLQIEKMRDEQLTKEVTNTVKSFNHIVSEEQDDVVSILKSLDDENRTKIVEIFKKADSAIEATEKGLLNELGEKATHNEGDTPTDELEKAAKDLMEKDATLKYDEAVSKAIEKNPELYNNTRNAGGK